MGQEEIINRILADAERESQEIISAAEIRAKGIVAEANARAKQELGEAQATAEEYTKALAEGKAATVRLDSAKILLAEKRRVIDEIYAKVLQKLVALKEKDALSLLERLLKEYAEEGDEIVLAENFKYAEGLSKLSVLKQKKLTLSSGRADISGGLLLRGKKSDKDLSYSAVLRADMEEHQADIAARLFERKDG